MEGLFIDPRAPRLRDEIVQFYNQTAPLTCAVETRATSAHSTPVSLVHDHLCEAGHNVALAYRNSGKPDQAMATAQTAVSGLGCPRTCFSAMPRPGQAHQPAARALDVRSPYQSTSPK